jgi:hypothetical protein
MFDRCEEFLNQFIDRVAEEPKCFIGEEHPFGPLLSVVAVRVPREEKIMALLVPLSSQMKLRYRSLIADDTLQVQLSSMR